MSVACHERSLRYFRHATWLVAGLYPLNVPKWLVYFTAVLLVAGLSVISVPTWDFLFIDAWLVAGLGAKSIPTRDFVFFKGCLASGWFKCYECSYMNYDSSDYRCVTSPANATNVRVRECRQGAAETCVTKTVYTKGIL